MPLSCSLSNVLATRSEIDLRTNLETILLNDRSIGKRSGTAHSMFVASAHQTVIVQLPTVRVSWPPSKPTKTPHPMNTCPKPPNTSHPSRREHDALGLRTSRREHDALSLRSSSVNRHGIPASGSSGRQCAPCRPTPRPNRRTARISVLSHALSPWSHSACSIAQLRRTYRE